MWNKLENLSSEIIVFHYTILQDLLFFFFIFRLFINIKNGINSNVKKINFIHRKLLFQTQKMESKSGSEALVI